MRNYVKRNILIFLIFLLVLTSIPSNTLAAGIQDCPLPSSYDADSLILIEQNNIPTSITTGKGKKILNGNFLSNKCGMGGKLVVYGSPLQISTAEGNEFDQGQWRYLGWDINGNLYRNWLFRSDSRATLNVAKNWVKAPWDTPVGISKRIEETPDLTSHPDAKKWLEAIVDPYKESPTFIQSYNNRTGKGWTGDILRDYVVIQQKPTDFSPGIIQMWNIWQPDGSWWYEMFYIPPLNKLEIKKQPDLLISALVNPADAWVGDSVPIKITTKNQGTEDSGAFTVGIVGTTIKSEVISNVPPGQIKTVTVNVSSTTSGIKSFTAKTDFGEAVAESNEQNNTKDFKIAFNKKNEPTTPIAIISHLEGDHRTEPEITIKPAAVPKLDDKLSYSPGKEAITVREWRFKNPAGKTIATKPVVKDFAAEGKYVVELRVTNSAKKVSEWAQLIINVATKATPNPSASPTPTPEPTPTPRPELKAAIRFEPDEILAGETSSLLNSSDGYDSYEWTFSSNLDSLFTDKTKYEYYDQTFTQPGTYRATIKVSDSSGSATSEAALTVIDPKPVAIVAGPTRVIEGRPFPVPYHLNNSYTPLEDRGVSIDHSKDEKRYKKVGDASYTANFPTVNNIALGQYSLEGKVYDSMNRVSDWATLLVDVVPDMPPTIEVIAPPESYRSNGFMLYIEAESPDADILMHLFLEERYDQDGDGNFDEEVWKTLYDGTYKTTHSLNYATVGKRQYRATVTEDYGKSGASPLAATDILNYAPSVNFNAFGVTQQPGQGEDSAPPVTSYTPESIFRSWTLKTPYTGGNGDKLGWKVDGSSIRTKNAELVKFISEFPDAGSGANSRNKYPLASDLVAKPRWAINANYSYDYKMIPKIFNNNRMYLYKVVNGNLEYSERDAVTGQELRVFNLAGFSFMDGMPQLEDDERFYSQSVVNQNSVKIIVRNNKGDVLDTHVFGLVGLQQDWNYQATLFKLLPDQRTALIGVEYSNYNSRMSEMKYYKYSFENRSLQWAVSGSQYSMNALTGYYDTTSYVTISNDGTMYIAGAMVSKISPNGTRIDSALLTGAIDSSAISISNDGQFIYLKNLAYISGDYAKNNFTTYRTSDLAVVNQYTGLLPEYYRWGNSDLFDESPMVREDGVVVIIESATAYFFSNSGSFLFSSLFSNWSFKEFGTPSIMINGQLLIPSYDMGDKHKNMLINRSTDSIIVSEPVTQYWEVNTAVGLVSTTPVLPNGAVFTFDMKSQPNTVTPFVSASGKTSAQAINADTIGIFDDNWGGLLYDATSTNKNYALEFNVSVNDIVNAKTIGAGFQIQNEMNMYAMEWNQNTVSLYRVVNGAKTLLQSTPLARTAFSTYPIKVESVNGTQRVYVNYAKVLEVADGTYLKGYAGIMSLGQPNSIFSNVKKTNYGDTYTQETYDSVLVNDPISYEKLFNDIEKDPISAEEWSYSHNPSIFENPQGLSIHNGKTYGSTINALDKAGVYEITFRAKDNPGLSGYSKWSEPVKKLLYVHRRPVAQPDVRFTGKVFAEGEALDYDTYDTSYDPDIAHILSDKIFRTRWADQSTWTAGKREYYNRPGVELIVQEQVRDIHGAWSYWGQHIVYKDAIPPVNQTKPVMSITVPAGTAASAPTVLIKEPAIKWNYFDAENDLQEQYRLMLTYVDNNETALYIEHEGNALSYSILAASINPGRVVKVQGQVYSAGVWSNLSNIRYFVLDLPPETFLLNLNGPDADHPIYMNTNRPQLRVFTLDPENHSITAIDYEVYRASSGAKVIDTGLAASAASYTTAPLAEGLHYWRARSNDGYLWGPYSGNGFFFVDTVKPADVNEQLAIEQTAVSVTFNAFTDAEPSSGHAARAFYLQRVNGDGSVSNIDLNGDGSPEYSIPLALDRQSYQVTGLTAGQEYRLTVLDYDAAGNEGHFSYIHFVTNRPPTADFDWTPKPVYEGDMTSFLSQADDPDGNTLSIAYELTSPLGVKSSYSYTVNGPSYQAKGPSVKLTTVGMWSMTMRVSDGIGDPVSVTKTLQVLPLHVVGYVKHTDLWDERRRSYNTAQTGQPDSPRFYSIFWAGEKFILEADTTLTGTATKAERVEVKMSGYSTVLDKSNAAQTGWRGEMWENAFAQLEQGEIKFLFTAYYTNGTIKEAAVEVSIAGNILDNVGVHRVQ